MSSSLNASLSLTLGLNIACISSFLVKSTLFSHASGFKSLYITNLVKLKKPKAILVLTFHSPIPLTESLTSLK